LASFLALPMRWNMKKDFRGSLKPLPPMMKTPCPER